MALYLLAGVIDADYRGNVGVVLFNFGDSDFTSNILFLSWTVKLAFFFSLSQLKKVIELLN